MRRISVPLAIALATLLSGCFGSDRPMFPPESGVSALEPGRYALFEQYGDQSKPSEYMEIRQRGSVYDFVNEKGASNPVSFHPIAGGMHVAQVGGMPRAGTDKTGYGYALFKMTAARRWFTWSSATSRTRRCSKPPTSRSAANTNASSTMSPTRPRSLPR